jgi:two-component system OmpR family response regulator
VRVLVVDDDVSVATSLQRTLSADGLDVAVVLDGRDALEIASRETFDLIVLDLLLPSMNGYRVCQAIRAAGDWTPILMLTAKTGEYDESDGLDSGADDFLRKPFSMVVLQARARALLRRPRRGLGRLVAGDLRLDPVHRTCTCGERVVSLSAREIEVLAFLMEHAGCVVEKRQVLDRIWGIDFAGDENIVEVYVGRLRRKLDRAGARRSVETVRGVGYRLAGG